MKSLLIKINLIVTSILVTFCALHAQSYDYSGLPCFEKNYRVLVHITVDSVAREPIIPISRVELALQQVSEFYDPICLSFESCEINIIENDYSYSRISNDPISVRDKLDKMVRLFSKPSRINIFICQSIKGRGCGVAEFEGITKKDKANIWTSFEECGDGLAENIAHQIGHLFGLANTNNFTGEDALVDGTNCQNSGDFICDTPADPFGQFPDLEFKDYVQSCEYVLNEKDPNGDFYETDPTNIMSPYPCKCRFSTQQFEKIAETYYSSTISQY